LGSIAIPECDEVIVLVLLAYPFFDLFTTLLGAFYCWRRPTFFFASNPFVGPMAVAAAPITPNMAAATSPKEAGESLPPKRLTKEELLKTHKSHLKKQDLSPDGPRPVKQPVMAEAYPASTKSIREVDIVILAL